MIAMAIIHFMYTNEKRVVSIVRATQRKPVERQPKHPVHAGRDGERPQDECSFSFYYNRKSPKRTDRTVFPHPARTVRRAAARHRNSANKLCTDDRSEQLITLHHKPSPDDRRIKEQNDITLRGRPRWVTAGYRPTSYSGPACQKTLPLYIIHDTCFEKRLETPIVFYARPDNTLRVCECPNDGHELFCGMAEKLLDMPPQHRRTSFYPAV